MMDVPSYPEPDDTSGESQPPVRWVPRLVVAVAVAIVVVVVLLHLTGVVGPASG